jgi:transposase
MRHIAGYDRSQTLLLPESLDEYVGPENPVRFIEAFVDGLDLTAAGFARVTPKVTGRPGYAPTDLLKLYIYGYLNRARSSRRLEAETHRNIEVIWLLRHLKPDFKTIADFRRDNASAFRPIFRQFVLPIGPGWPGVDRGGRHADQGGQQQRPQLHPLIADRVHQTCRRQARRLPPASGPERCHRESNR